MKSIKIRWFFVAEVCIFFTWVLNSTNPMVLCKCFDMNRMDALITRNSPPWWGGEMVGSAEGIHRAVSSECSIRDFCRRSSERGVPYCVASVMGFVRRWKHVHSPYVWMYWWCTTLCIRACENKKPQSKTIVCITGEEGVFSLLLAWFVSIRCICLMSSQYYDAK